MKENISIRKSCKVCGSEFIAHSKKGTFCSLNCAKVHRSHLQFPNGSQYVECKICGFRSSQIYRHIQTVHQMELDEYCKRFQVSKEDLISQKSHEKMSQSQSLAIAEGRSVGWGFGDKNPSRSEESRNGRRSIWSMNFKGYDGLSDDEKIKRIHENGQRANDTKDKNHSHVLRIDYWTERGYTIAQAKEMIAERQNTFSLQKCIDKYGSQEGRRIFEQRQEKWQNTLKSKPREEIERINKSKMSTKGYSKISQKLFDAITRVIGGDYKKIFYATVNGTDSAFCEYMVHNEVTGHNFFLDFYVQDNNKVIEFDGDYWHGEKRGNQERDRKREEELRSLGYVNILRVKERDYIADPEKVIQECIEFIRK